MMSLLRGPAVMVAGVLVTVGALADTVVFDNLAPVPPYYANGGTGFGYAGATSTGWSRVTSFRRAPGR